MKTALWRLVAAVLFIVPATAAHGGQAAPDIAYYFPGVEFDASIPAPQDYFGYQVGEWHLRHDQVVNYLRQLAETSQRVQCESYGQTHENRDLILLTISTPANLDTVAAIRKRHKDLCDPAKPAPNLDAMHAVVWLGYGVHGNEASAMNAAVLVAYYLAAARGPEVERVLSRSIVLLDPCFNPDGNARFAQWVNSHKGRIPVADPATREHNEVWPSGRTNHYWFDLNRDWMPVQQPESRGRLERFRSWMPNVLTDAHEMGANSTFFFQPGIPSRNYPLTPQATFDLTAKIADYHAAAFNTIGSLYYTRESFDDFYIGKGSTYPDINGCIGILFEQASARGHVQETVNGDLTFPFAVRNHVSSSLSTLRAVADLRPELLKHQREFFVSALREADKHTVKAYVFGDTQDPARTYHLLDILRRHEITVHKLARDVNAGGHAFQQGAAYVVPLKQPQYRFARALLETRSEFEDSLFYDVSSWTLPLAFNVPYAALPAAEFSTALLGDTLGMADFPIGTMQAAPEGTYAYAFEWQGYYAPRALYRLLEAEVNCKVATAPFTARIAGGSKRFAYGTIVVALGIQSVAAAEIRALMEHIAREDGIDVYGLHTGLSQAGPDLGSPGLERVEKPSVVLLAGDGVYPYSAGEVWHLLDTRYHMPLSIIEARSLRRTNLNRYGVTVLVDGNYSSLDADDVEELRRWVERGGVLVCTESAVQWAVRKGLAQAAYRDKQKDAGDSAQAAAVRPYAGMFNDLGAQYIGGAIFAARIDSTHPLGYGYARGALSLFRNNRIFLQSPDNRYAAPLQYEAEALQSGYISEQNQRWVSSAAGVIVNSLGSGRVILLSDNPNFRAFWYGTNKLFANALFFGKLIAGRATVPVRSAETTDRNNDEQD